ncbi:FimD/PapC C-terminal domain-containing protein, partial [Providencia sp. PROV120]
GLVHFNSQSEQGTVIVKWGEGSHQRCKFDYNISSNSSISESVCYFY